MRGRVTEKERDSECITSLLLWSWDGWCCCCLHSFSSDYRLCHLQYVTLASWTGSGVLFRTLQSSLYCSRRQTINYICVLFTFKAQWWNMWLWPWNISSPEQPNVFLPVFRASLKNPILYLWSTSPGAELNCNRVTLAWCNGCQRDY